MAIFCKNHNFAENSKERFVKKQRKGIAFLFLAISIIMLIAIVFPHHHHWQELCLVEHCCEEDTDHSSSEHHHHCANDCKTNACITQFHCPQPPSNESFAPLLYPEIIYIFSTYFSDLILSDREIKHTPIPYHECLHSYNYVYGSALRAPPFNMV